jgi:hypothetical protein
VRDVRARAGRPAEERAGSCEPWQCAMPARSPPGRAQVQSVFRIRGVGGYAWAVACRVFAPKLAVNHEPGTRKGVW